MSTREPLASMNTSKTVADPCTPDQAATKHEDGEDRIDMIREAIGVPDSEVSVPGSWKL